MPRLSIVIPCIRDAGQFETTLASVLQNRPNDCEVVVVQPRVYDDPYQLRDEVRFVEAPASSSLVQLINRGIAVAEGEIIHLLACDVAVHEGWNESAMRHFQDPLVASVSPLVLVAPTDKGVVWRGVDYLPGGQRRARCSAPRRRQRSPLGPTLSAGWYRRSAVDQVGGFCIDVGAELADVDMGLLLQAAGYRCVHEEDCLVLCEALQLEETLGYDAGRAAERLFWRHTPSGQWAEILVAHPLVWLREAVRHCLSPGLIPQWLGRLHGLRERKRALLSAAPDTANGVRAEAEPEPGTDCSLRDPAPPPASRSFKRRIAA